MTGVSWPYIVALTAAPIVAWIGSIVVNRGARAIGKALSPQRACFIGGFSTLVALVVLAQASLPSDAPQLARVTAAAFAFIFGFCVNFMNWFIFTVTETSMHMHLLVEVGEEGVPRSELERRYDKAAIIRARVPRLLGLGQLRIERDRLLVGGRWVLASARGIRLLRRALGLPPIPPQVDDPPPIDCSGLRAP